MAFNEKYYKKFTSFIPFLHITKCLERAFYALLVSLVATSDENTSARSTVGSNP